MESVHWNALNWWCNAISFPPKTHYVRNSWMKPFHQIIFQRSISHFPASVSLDWLIVPKGNHHGFLSLCRFPQSTFSRGLASSLTSTVFPGLRSFYHWRKFENSMEESTMIPWRRNCKSAGHNYAPRDVVEVGRVFQDNMLSSGSSRSFPVRLIGYYCPLAWVSTVHTQTTWGTGGLGCGNVVQLIPSIVHHDQCDISHFAQGAPREK